MIGEREDILNENTYGNLTMRPYVIDGNEINAFYDNDGDLVFVLDNTINQTKPNVLLVINPSGDKKWDEILSGQYDVDLETIRPKQDNKYQKLDIEYSGLSVYENLINAYVAGDDLDEHLVQLNILRDSAARHSAMTRLNVANEIISKTNVTIVKTKESIVRLQNRVKTLRAKLSEAKKSIGKVAPKQSAAKILKIESQIEATNEKLKRAQKRLESAQKRLETATVDAELASDLLNQPALEIQNPVKNKPVIVAPKYELQKTDDEDIEDNEEELADDADDDEDFSAFEDKDDEEEYDDDTNNEIKPLFDENPNNLNEDIAFKPISFDTPAITTPVNTDNTSVPVFNPEPIFEDKEEESETEDFVAPDISLIQQPKPVLESMTPVNQEEPKPVLESITPVTEEPVQQTSVPVHQEVVPVADTEPEIVAGPELPAVAPVAPVPPVVNTFNANVTPENSRSKPTFMYYLLLIVLIILSIFTLWLYQKHIGTNEPLLTANVEQQSATESQPKPVERLKIKKAVKETQPVAVEIPAPVDEYEFVDTEESVETADVVEPVQEEPVETDVIHEPEVEEPVQQNMEPVIMDAVPARMLTSGESTEEYVVDTDEASVDKPVYEAGSKHDNMFVSEQDYHPAPTNENVVVDEDMYYEDEYYEE